MNIRSGKAIVNNKGRTTRSSEGNRDEQMPRIRQLHKSPQDAEKDDCHEEIQEIQSKSRIEMLETDLDRRQESYIRRERAYKTRIEELESELSKLKSTKTGSWKGESSMTAIREMHQLIMNNVEHVQDKTAKILQDQERDLLRSFRSTLFDVQTELEVEKNKTDDGAFTWIEKSRQLGSELDWAKQMADRLDIVNQNLLRENQRLKSQFKTQEEDREFLIKQLVAVKKDNARFKQEYEEVKAKYEECKGWGDPSTTNGSSTRSSNVHKDLSKVNDVPETSYKSGSRSNTASAQKPGLGEQADHRYKEIIKRMKKLLEVERKNLKQVRAAYTNEIQQKKELEVFLQQCVADVKNEIASHRQKPQTLLHGNKEMKPTIEEFSEMDRVKVIEKLFSKERVIDLIYSKSFPSKIRNQVISSSVGLHPDDCCFQENEKKVIAKDGELSFIEQSKVCTDKNGIQSKTEEMEKKKDDCLSPDVPSDFVKEQAIDK